jgi:hypothetical protein
MTLGFALPLLAPTPASAGSGWDFAGRGKFVVYGTNGSYWTQPYGLSAGTNFLTCINTKTNIPENYYLHEYDEGNNADESVDVQTQTGSGCLEWKGISDYVDGANDRAEFYIFTYDSQATSVDYFD